MPIGGTYPGTVQLSASPTGPILATYTFSPSEIDKMGGPADITLTVATRKLASAESPKDISSRLSHIALGLFLLPSPRPALLSPLSRKADSHDHLLPPHPLVPRSHRHSHRCGSGYFDRTYPITVTAISNGIQHSVERQVPTSTSHLSRNRSYRKDHQHDEPHTLQKSSQGSQKRKTAQRG